MAISPADVAKLRKLTGAGMMDCKQALEETNGDFQAAIDVLRKKGQKVAAKRADREATEGVVLTKAAPDNKSAAMIVLNCETDFVAKNQDFIAFAEQILEVALHGNPANLDALREMSIGGVKIADEVANKTGIIGEKVDLSFYQRIEAAAIATYIHPGNKLAAMVGFNKENVPANVAKDVAMQVAAMDPVAIDKGDVPAEILARELEIGKEQAINEGKPAEMAEKIAQGRINKFYQDSTLLNQQYVKDNKMTVRDFMKSSDKDLTVSVFKRFNLG